MSDPATALTDDDVDRFIADPALILTHEHALEVLAVLDDEIASIQAQIDAAQIESNAKPLAPDRLRWVQRASYAAAMRRNDRHKVYQRDKELRGTKNFGGNPPDPTKKEANLLKQQRLADEVAIRRTAKAADHLRLQNEREALALQRRQFQADQTIANLKARLEAADPRAHVEKVRQAIFNTLSGEAEVNTGLMLAAVYEALGYPGVDHPPSSLTPN